MPIDDWIRETETSLYRVHIADLVRDLPVVPVDGGRFIAFLNIVGDAEVVVHASKALSSLIPTETELLVCPEVGGLILGHQLSLDCGVPFVGIRKKRKPYMVDPRYVDVQTIGSHAPQQFVYSDYESRLMKGKRVAFIDEVISSGATLTAIETIIDAVGATLVAKLCIADEGAHRDDVLSLCRLPVLGSAQARNLTPPP